MAYEPVNDPPLYRQALADMRATLALPSVGVHQAAELAHLEELIAKYPERAAEILQRRSRRSPEGAA